jgi:hypothetical protein
MFEDEADGVPIPDSAGLLSFLHEVATPDPDVLDNARFRLSARYPASGTDHPGEMPAWPLEDVRAIRAVIEAARGGGGRRGDALDVGAGLVMLCNLRLYVDRLEADLLDGAQQVDLNWDVIAAIIGIPAEQARRRHAVLRARRDHR